MWLRAPVVFSKLEVRGALEMVNILVLNLLLKICFFSIFKTIKVHHGFL